MFLLLGPDDLPPEMSGELGQIKDELESSYPNRGAYIKYFYSTGPKSYAYDVYDSNGYIGTETKLKGIRMNSSLSKIFDTSETFSRVVSNRDTIDAQQLTFLRNVDAQTVKTSVCWKKFQFSSEKRRILPSEMLDSVPYGYVD